ncbi:ATP phosphoribosyltransferase [Lactococcus allomyrinae]|uniref:ATP phosphoribosyltransferase n=1 Tax=Lactococcus allomyrinae TaxID=2419773 RepID=A0A387BDN7_9LACT|nr:ATP phosphoribosyltransferase [Lactococcus allomyrinae]AYG00182.1 ATP phosphoribosyltransferase [Lactococcus allomyrinae]
MLKIAVTKGRIQEQLILLLQKSGYDTQPIINMGRSLEVTTTDDLQFIFGKANDVVTFLEHGVVDIGFVGKDTLQESDFDDYYELFDLQVGQCYFALAAYPDFKNKTFHRRKRIASKYPKVAKAYFSNQKEDVEIIKLEGSVELGPVVGLSDAIIDIVETGNTLAANGLEIIEKISDISTRMIVNKASFRFKQQNILQMVTKFEKAGKIK